METILQKALEAEARKRLERFHQEVRRKHDYGWKFTKRTAQSSTPSKKLAPSMWGIHNHFDPRYCLKHSRFIARGVWNSLSSGEYSPMPALTLLIPKASGGERPIDVFSVPDAAVSNVFAERLIRRNENLYSDSSYAYQHTKSALEAIIRLRHFSKREIVFVIQYDFCRYFESIQHGYLSKVLNNKGLFLTTRIERNFIAGFLKHRHAKMDDYLKGKFIERSAGIPQGASISLFLANVASHELDLELSLHNGCFARFADDTVVLAYSYEDAIRAAEAFEKHAERSGISINREKSIGIRPLGGDGHGLVSVRQFDFLGHAFSKEKISLSDKAVARIKQRVSHIINIHLLLYPKKYSAFNPARIGLGFYDWDLVTCLNELRRYMYGGLSESNIGAHLSDSLRLRRAKGLMAFYCLIDDQDILHSLDGWLVSVLRRAYVQRTKVLAALGYTLSPLSKQALVSGSWYNYPPLAQESRCPSFFRAWRSARKSWEQHGVCGIHVPPHGYDFELY